MNEAETRAGHIDPLLTAAGWGVIEGSRIRREHPITLGRIEGHGKRGKALSADYVLEYRNTKFAVVEAKAWDVALTEPCEICGKVQCTCEKRKKAMVKLADGKERNIQHMMTTFWHPDCTPMSAQQFMEMLFGKLPDFFADEEELRELWSVPLTRAKLLDGLAEKDFGYDQLTEMQKIIDAENSDLCDVLAHVAYALPTLSNGRQRPRWKSAPAD